MILTGLIVVSFLAFLGVLAWGPYYTDVHRGERTKVSLRALCLIPLALTVALLAWGTTTTVDARNVGVLTTFKKPAERTLDPGFSWKLPWQGVTEIDGRKTTTQYGSGGVVCGGDSEGTELAVRVGDGTTSCVTIMFKYQIIPEKAGVIFGDYRDSDPVEKYRKDVLSPTFKSATLDVMGAWNPSEQAKQADADGTTPTFAPDYSAFEAEVLTSVRAALLEEGLVDVYGVEITFVSVSKQSQSRMDSIVAEAARTLEADQAVKTAEKKALANEVIADSVSNNPGVLQSRCIDALTAAIEAEYALPAGFNCLGDGSAIVVPSAPAPKD